MPVWGLRVAAALLATAMTFQANAAAAQTKLKIAFPSAPNAYALPHFVAAEKGWLKEAGLVVEEKWLNSDITAMRMIATGEADLCIAGMPAAFFAVGAGAQIKAIGSHQAITKETPSMGFSYIMATSKALNNAAKKQAMEAYVEQSAIRGSRFVMDHPEEAVQILLKRVPSLDPEIARQAVADLNRDQVWGVNGGLEREVTDFTIKFTLDSKMMPNSVSYDQVVDPSLVNAALARTGKR